ncbi:MAG: fumarylacetoacetate hydrolase family protein [Solirubrobacterales bacterium]
MRWATYGSTQDGQDHAALIEAGKLRALPAGIHLIDLISGEGMPMEAAAVWARTTPFEVIDFSAAKLRSPIPEPPSMRDFLSFENHYVNTRTGLGLEVDPLFYEQPSFYFTNPAAVVDPVSEVTSAPGTEQFDFELEVAAVIGRRGSDLTLDDAEDHIAGYTMFCDWSARDLQALETPFGTGPAKGKDTATSVGPVLVTPDELEPFRSGNGFDLEMKAFVNGKQYSAGNWNSVYWSMAQLLVFASRGTELRPGDVIGTGTVGTGSIMELAAVHGEDQYPWLVPGDEIKLQVQELGEMAGKVIPAHPTVPFKQ